VDMIGHDAPSPEEIAPLVEVLNDFGDHFGDARVLQVTLTETVVEATLRLLKNGVELGGASAIGGDTDSRLVRAMERVTLLANPLKQFAGKSIGEAEGDEINGMIAFPVREVAARANRWRHSEPDS
jgi:hypothetical protein